MNFYMEWVGRLGGVSTALEQLFRPANPQYIVSMSCLHCQLPSGDHVGEEKKCLFEATNYEPYGLTRTENLAIRVREELKLT